MRFRRILLILLALTLSTPLLMNAQTINATSCSASDVQTAFSSVTSTTTRINIPAGTCHWTTQVTLTVPSGSTTLSVIGAGSATTTGGGDRTVFIDDYASSNSPLVIVTNSNASAFFRIAGITFQGGSGSVKYKGFMMMQGNSSNVRIDHDHFNMAAYGSSGASSAGAQLQGCILGVADHNIIDAASGSVSNGIQEYQGGCGGDSYGFGDVAWASDTGLGTSNSFYLEDNIINNGAANDCLYGGRFVFRFNSFNMSPPAPSLQTHGTGSLPSAGRGCRSWEIYKNTFTTNGYTNALFFVDSGTGVMWGNTIPAGGSGSGAWGYKSIFDLMAADRYDGSDHAQTAVPNGWGYCGSNRGPSNWDQNSDSSGHLCLDQPGAGKGDLLAGDFAKDGGSGVCNQTLGCKTTNGQWPRQAQEPIYEWADAFTPVPQNQSGIVANNYPIFQANRDYFTGTGDNGAAVAFNGSSGVGSGPLASRPSTCTTGVAYWATDQGNWNSGSSGGQGELFKCTAANTWTLFYTPYAYPHPLVSGTQAAQSPMPPQSLTSTVK